jgi:DNA repair exonuclease SbcCD ATPase subunit
MTPADDEILSKLHDYVLDPPVVETAIHNALAELQPSHEERDRRRTALQTEIRKLDEEQERLVAAISAAGQIDALARALQQRERQKARLVAELAALGQVSRHSSTQATRLERELRERLTEWRALLHRRTPLARQVVSKLLDRRIAWTPFQNERRCEYQGRVKLDHLLAGACLRQRVYRYGDSNPGPVAENHVS